MELDFTALNSLSLQVAREDFREPIEEAEGQDAQRIGDTEDRATHILDGNKRERDNARQMFTAYQQNIQRAGELRAGITKGLQAGEPPLAILLKALEAIGLMTGDTTTYTQQRDTIKAVYGWGMGEQIPLGWELAEAKERLRLLSRPENTGEGTPPDAQQRIQKAVEVHRRLIAELELREGAGA